MRKLSFFVLLFIFFISTTKICYASFILTDEIIGDLSPHSIGVISTSPTKYANYIESMQNNFDDVVVTEYEQWAIYSNTYPFNSRLIVDLGLKPTDDHYNKSYMTLCWWYSQYGYIQLDFKDASGNIVHKFEFDKSGHHNSGYISFDGQIHRERTTVASCNLYGYIIIENNELKFIGEYSDVPGHDSGIESKTWTMAYFDQIKTVDISIGTIGRTAGDGVARIPLVIFSSEQTDITENQCWASYENGKLHIPCIKVKGPFGDEFKYEADLQYKPLSEPMIFELTGAKQKQ
jgi:hypothetical protein